MSLDLSSLLQSTLTQRLDPMASITTQFAQEVTTSLTAENIGIARDLVQSLHKDLVKARAEDADESVIGALERLVNRATQLGVRN